MHKYYKDTMFANKRSYERFQYIVELANKANAFQAKHGRIIVDRWGNIYDYDPFFVDEDGGDVTLDNLDILGCLGAEVKYRKDNVDTINIPVTKKEIKQFFNSLQIAAVHKNNLKF